MNNLCRPRRLKLLKCLFAQSRQCRTYPDRPGPPTPSNPQERQSNLDDLIDEEKTILQRQGVSKLQACIPYDEVEVVSYNSSTAVSLPRKMSYNRISTPRGFGSCFWHKPCVRARASVNTARVHGRGAECPLAFWPLVLLVHICWKKITIVL